MLFIELAQFSGYDQLSWQQVDGLQFSNVCGVSLNGYYGNNVILLGG